MIEFAMVLPLFLFILLFTVDMGRMVLLQAALQDATQQAARSGAQVGGANKNGNKSQTTFNEAVSNAPGMTTSRISEFSVLAGSSCTAFQPNVTIRTAYQADFVTPGLSTLLGVFTGDERGPEADWTLRATSVARCEVLRP
jgi:Flp pilus assembly protein TadG